MFADWTIDLSKPEHAAVVAGTMAAGLAAAVVRAAYRKLKESGAAKEVFGWACLVAGLSGFGGGVASFAQSCPPQRPPHDAHPAVVESYADAVGRAKNYPVPVEASIMVVFASIPLSILGGFKVAEALDRTERR